MARQLDEEKRQGILGAAFEAFGERGYRNTTIKDIADIAGIAPGSVYTYFDDKEALFRSTVYEGLNTFHVELKRIISLPDTFEVKFNRVIDFGFDLFKKVQPIFRGMFSEANRLDLFRNNIDELCEVFIELFLEGNRLGVIKMFEDNEMTRMTLRIFISGILFHTSLIPRDDLDIEIDKLKEQTKRGLQESFEMGMVR